MADITPNDIINKEFRMAFRGYSTEQVDEFLQHVSDRVFRLMEENQHLRAQTEEIRSRLQQYQQTEDMLKSALVLAERTADETRQRAQQEADLMRREAEVQLERQYNELDEIRQIRARLIAELRGVLYAHLSMLEDQEGRHSADHSAPAG